MLRANPKGAAVQKQDLLTDFTEITPAAAIRTASHGWRAKCLQRLVRLDLPVPQTVALPAATVRAIAAGHTIDCAAILGHFGADAAGLGPAQPGKPRLGRAGHRAEHRAECGASCRGWSQSHGQAAADALYLRFVQGYAIHVARLDPDMFEGVEPSAAALRDALRAYARRDGRAFPRRPGAATVRGAAVHGPGLGGHLGAAVAPGQGAPRRGGLGLVVQEMAQGIGQGISGSGVIQFVDPVTGQPQVTGRYLGQSQGRDALQQTDGDLPDPRSARPVAGRHWRRRSLPNCCAMGLPAVTSCAKRCRSNSPSRMAICRFWMRSRCTRSARAGLRIAVALADDGIITRNEAVLRVEPRALSELLHPQVDPRGPRDVFARGIAASPGAATGRIVFSSAAAQASCRAGRALHSGAARNRARRYSRHAFGRGRADRTRRHDQPCGGDRARASGCPASWGPRICGWMRVTKRW